MHLNIYIFFLYLILLLSQSCIKVQENSIKIDFRKKGIHPDGWIEKTEWSGFESISNLCSPWKSGMSDSTVFTCFCSEQYFNFYFDVIDRDIIVNDAMDEFSVTKGDRVELFFSPLPCLQQYYCIEISPNGDVLDYKARLYRNFDYSWHFQKYKIETQKAKDGYIVEGYISLQELNKLGINIRKGFYLGIFRAEFTSENQITWYSWIDPQVKEPDFHIPTAFGTARFNIFLRNLLFRPLN